MTASRERGFFSSLALGQGVRSSGVPANLITADRTKPQQLTDEDLAGRVRRGDHDAFAVLYDRHSHGVYDFVARIVRDREVAADATQIAFTTAWDRLVDSYEVDNVKAWLYAVARNAAIDEIRRRGRHKSFDPADEEQVAAFTRVEDDRWADPSMALHDRELRVLVWRSAAALKPDDYSLLDLYLRRDLDADDIAVALGLRKGALYTRLTRLRHAMGEAIEATLLLRRGRGECTEFDSAVARFDRSNPTPAANKAVRRHLRSCGRCQERRDRLASPAELLPAFAPVQLLPGLKDAIWERVCGRVAPTTHADDAYGADRQWRDANTAAGDPGSDMSGARPRSLSSRVGAGRSSLIAGLALLLLVAGTVEALRQHTLGAAAAAPHAVYSTSHRIETPSSNPVIAMRWDGPPHAVAYSVGFTRARSADGSLTTAVPAATDRTFSDRLASGSWYFHIRALGADGKWSAPAIAGPYVITTAGQLVGARSEGPRGRKLERGRERSAGGSTAAGRTTSTQRRTGGENRSVPAGRKVTPKSESKPGSKGSPDSTGPEGQSPAAQPAPPAQQPSPVAPPQPSPNSQPPAPTPPPPAQQPELPPESH